LKEQEESLFIAPELSSYPIYTVIPFLHIVKHILVAVGTCSKKITLLLRSQSI
jgi:hypothetical protein